MLVHSRKALHNHYKEGFPIDIQERIPMGNLYVNRL